MAQTGNPEKTVPRASQKAISKVTLFGQIGYLTNFSGSTIHLEFWLEPDPGWQPVTDDPHALMAISSKCLSKSTVTHVGCPFEFTLLFSDQEEDLHTLKTAKLYARIVRNHSSERESTEAFGCVVIPFKAGHYRRTVETFKPISNGLKDRLIEEFFGYSFDLENLSETKYFPIGLINSESKGFFTIDFNVVVQSNKIHLDLDEKNSLKSNISQIIEAFRRARQRLIWLKMKALNS